MAPEDIGQLCLQIHPGRAPGLDIEPIASACREWATRTQGVRGIAVTDGEDEGSYVNIVFAADDPVSAWQSLRPLLFTPANAALSGASLCMCTGDEGWDDYRLLHHFDPSVVLDVPDER